MSKRRDSDYYPTPPDAVRALGLWIHRHVPFFDQRKGWLDPAAGTGALIRGLKDVLPSWQAMDVNPAFEPHLRPLAWQVHIGDALLSSAKWEHVAGGVVMNPPFRFLEGFVHRAMLYRRNTEGWVFVLTRVQWLDDGRDRQVRFAPSRILRMPWRLDFKGDGRSEATTHCWLVYEPGAAGEAVEVEWLARPVVSRAEWRQHRELSQLVSDRQGDLLKWGDEPECQS